MREIWKDIENFEGLYKISNLGRVLSTGKKRKLLGTGNYDRKEIILKQFPNNKGYMVVHLYKNGKDYQKLVHRLVAQTFILNPSKLPIVNHKDENPSNNNADNLEWCTQKYNMNYGTVPSRIGAKNGKSVIQMDSDGNEINIYTSVSDAERITGICKSCIFECLAKRRKKAGGYVWQYEK